MHGLIVIGFFVGISLMLVVGLFDVTSELKLRVEHTPRQEASDDADEIEP